MFYTALVNILLKILNAPWKIIFKRCLKLIKKLYADKKYLYLLWPDSVPSPNLVD